MIMRIRKKLTLAAATLLLMGTAACSDLEVTNEGAADTDRVLQSPEDVQALVSGAYRTWWGGWFPNGTPVPFLSTASFQHSAYPANFVMVDYSKFPRIPITNSTAGGDAYNFAAFAWSDNYRAIAAVAQAFNVFYPASGTAMTLGDAEKDNRFKILGRLVQGVAHGYLALLYDQAYIFDETVDPAAEVDLSSYSDVMEAALGYLDEAIGLAKAGPMAPIPYTWMGYAEGNGDLSAAELVRFAHSMKARLRANVARTSAERKNVDWTKVTADVSAGITKDWKMNIDQNTWDGSGSALRYSTLLGWGQLNYHVAGMADQSGKYQKWMATPLDNRDISVDGEPFLIITPDARFPQGATVAEQFDNAGTLWQIPRYLDTKLEKEVPGMGEQWKRPDRGTWRWSYYNTVNQGWAKGVRPVITKAEMDLLKAEAHYHASELGDVATIVNTYRTAAGLSATDAAGANGSCVPKLPNGTCGDLWEMMKWEKRMSTWYAGPYLNSWYFDGRGWGDLPEGTFLQFPVPERELFLLGIPTYTFGGAGGESAAPKGTYGY